MITYAKVGAFHADTPIVIDNWAINALQVSKFAELVSDPPKAGDEKLYRFVDGDAAHPTTLRIGSYPSVDGKGKNNYSVKLTTWLKRTNDDSSVDYSEETYVIAKGTPWIAFQEEDVAVFLTLLSVFSGTITAGAADNDGAKAAEFGVADLLSRVVSQSN